MKRLPVEHNKVVEEELEKIFKDPEISSLVEDILRLTQSTETIDSLLEKVNVEHSLLSRGPDIFQYDNYFTTPPKYKFALIKKSQEEINKISKLYDYDPHYDNYTSGYVSVETTETGQALAARCACGKYGKCRIIGYELVDLG